MRLTLTRDPDTNADILSDHGLEKKSVVLTPELAAKLRDPGNTIGAFGDLVRIALRLAEDVSTPPDTDLAELQRQALGETPSKATFLDELQIDMPAEFSAAEFTEFMARVRSVLLKPKGVEWHEFAGASNLMGWRFRSAVDSFEDFAKSWHEHGDGGANHEEIYLRDRALFGVFSCGVSCIEATCYGIYALASHPKILGLPFGPKEQKRAYPTQLRDALRGHSSANGLVGVLDKMLNSAKWETWIDFRNRMAHRSNLPRIITMAAGAPLPESPPLHLAATSSTKAFKASIEELQELLVWLGTTQRELFVAATGLVPA